MYVRACVCVCAHSTSQDIQFQFTHLSSHVHSESHPALVRLVILHWLVDHLADVHAAVVAWTAGRGPCGPQGPQALFGWTHQKRRKDSKVITTLSKHHHSLKPKGGVGLLGDSHNRVLGHQHHITTYFLQLKTIFPIFNHLFDCIWIYLIVFEFICCGTSLGLSSNA